jgi:hypothetical protein
MPAHSACLGGMVAVAAESQATDGNDVEPWMPSLESHLVETLVVLESCVELQVRSCSAAVAITSSQGSGPHGEPP